MIFKVGVSTHFWRLQKLALQSLIMIRAFQCFCNSISESSSQFYWSLKLRLQSKASVSNKLETPTDGRCNPQGLSNWKKKKKGRRSGYNIVFPLGHGPFYWTTELFYTLDPLALSPLELDALLYSSCLFKSTRFRPQLSSEQTRFCYCEIIICGICEAA